MFRKLLSAIFLAVAAPAVAAVAADQLAVAGNACGPTALLNSLRFGSEAWQRPADALSGESSKQKIYTIIREYGMRPSKSIPGRPRWSRKGVNLADLRDIANEMARGQYLPLVTEEILFATPRESPAKLLRRTHARLEKSLAKGLPPIVSLRRYVLRQETGKPAAWLAIDAHFVTISSLPGKLAKSATSFPVTYIDPWGGKIREGSIAIPTRPILANAGNPSPCLEAVFPASGVGVKKVLPGETTAIVIAAALGRW